jgi:pyruvate,water dikinase
MNWAIGGLVDLACDDPHLSHLFEQLGDDGNEWLRQAARQEDSGPFIAAWDDFVSRYGARGPSEIDIHKPRWYEDPLPVLRVIAAFLNSSRECHSALRHSLVDGREAAVHRLRTAAGRGFLGSIRVRLINRLYHTMTQVGGMREHHKFMVVRLLAVIKEILKGTADQLTAAGKLEQPDDIWFLTWDELALICDEKAADWGSLIAQRRADLERYERLTPPLIVTSDGESPVVYYRADAAPEGALLGNPVSVGVVEGVVHVIHDPQRETLAQEEILVAEFTDPGWTPLFVNAGGLILEVGGALTHGAVVAREYGIPAVVGVRDATTKLQTGQRVRVDGNRGIVEML